MYDFFILILWEMVYFYKIVLWEMEKCFIFAVENLMILWKKDYLRERFMPNC